MKFSIAAQIAEVERELKMRERVYPNLVRRRDMRQSEADYHLACMTAVLETLRWVETNRPAIIDWIKPRPAKPKDAA